MRLKILEVPTSVGTTVNVLETDIAHPVVGAQEIATVQQLIALLMSALTTVNVLEAESANQVKLVLFALEKATVHQKNAL